MSQTLKRKLRQSILPILQSWNVHDEEELANEIAEAAANVFLSSKDKLDLSKTDPAWTILFGAKVEQEAIDANVLIKNALETFERDMQTADTWNWYPARTSEETVWKMLREFVVERYKEDNDCFQKYQTWRTNPYARGAMSNLAIRKNPEYFPESWTDFRTANPSAPQTDQTPVQRDDNDTPVTY